MAKGITMPEYDVESAKDPEFFKTLENRYRVPSKLVRNILKRKMPDAMEGMEEIGSKRLSFEQYVGVKLIQNLERVTGICFL